MQAPGHRTKTSSPNRKPRAATRRGGRTTLLTAAALSALVLTGARAQTPPMRSPAPDARAAPESRESPLARWKESFDAFAEADRRHPPVAGGVLFVGSSSIRLWNGLAQDFQSLPVVTQRGFGGSRLSDCSAEVARLVLPYKPAFVVLYAGDNDLAEGAAPGNVLVSFRRFVESVRDELPGTRIAYLSIKPSPLRAALMPKVVEANALIADYVATVPNLDYIDIYTKMLGADGRPRSELFAPDMLHLNRAGYALWRDEILRHLPGLTQRGAGAALASSSPDLTPVAPSRGAR